MRKFAIARACAAVCFALLALPLYACNGNTVQSPTSQVKQCLFDTECMSTQRCAREKDNLMGVCVDKVAAQPGDGSIGTGAVTSAPSTAGPDGSDAAPIPPPAPTMKPQPGDINL